MEHENNYASKGQSNLNTVLGAIGTAGATGILNNMGGIFSKNNCNCSEDHSVNRYELSQQARISELETELKLRDSNIYTDSKILELYKYVDGKFSHVENQLCEQRVYNATNTAAISCIQGQVAQLAALTKVIIPIGNVCPQPMPQYNSWVAPTTPTGTTGA